MDCTLHRNPLNADEKDFEQIEKMNAGGSDFESRA